MSKIWSYIDGTLEPKEREAFERELAVSEQLRSEVELARILMASLANEPLSETSNHFGHNVLVEVSQQAALAAKPKPKHKLLRYLIPSTVAVAALIVLALILAPDDGSSSSPLLSVGQYSDALVGFLTSGISSLIVTLVTCGYILFWLDKVLRRRLLGK
jgi:anti-sigma factor RsiW